MDNKPYISVLIPLLNEQESLTELQERLHATLERIGKPYEIIYINDGSTDNTQQILEDFHARFPTVKVIEFNRNYGQHMALFAGFQNCQGEIVITIDGDLQNPPEEIPKLVRKMEEGYEVVGTYRKKRQDSIFRKLASVIVNKITSKLVGVKLRDYGCMLRAYRRSIIDNINMCTESSSFIPALANTFARKIVEIEVAHEERKRGTSKYSLFRLLRLNFDLMTSFSLLPIQFIGVLGVIIAALGFIFAVFLMVRRLIVGPEVEGAFTLFGILFFFIGIQIFALGIIGEYIGRIYQEVRKRPRFIIKKELS
jgi:undecaprenyl-phosphate 4-deoxy-4-formamido-L-arabinose transferase